MQDFTASVRRVRRSTNNLQTSPWIIHLMHVFLQTVINWKPSNKVACIICRWYVVLEPVVHMYPCFKRGVVYQLFVCKTGDSEGSEWSQIIFKWIWVAPWSFKINFESFRTFRVPLFLKQIAGLELLFGSTVHNSALVDEVKRIQMAFEGYTLSW